MSQDTKPIININSGISSVECKAFELLSHKEKLYAYYFTRAAWSGAKICYFQRSYEAPGLFYMLNKIFNLETPKNLGYRLLMSNSFTPLEIKQIYVYIAAFLQNCGNYKSFGDSKFVPDVSKERFWTFIQQTQAYEKQIEDFDQIWNLINFELFEYNLPYALIDLVEKDGQNSYYSPSLPKSLLEAIDKKMRDSNISELNTRIAELNGRVLILIASVEKREVNNWAIVEDHEVDLIYGDFSPFLHQLAKNLQQVASFTASTAQDNMVREYVDHFNSGDMEKHKESQKHWIQDRGPILETNIGFIETYLDPLKVRAEFEGFVAVVNQEESKILAKLVDNAQKFIEYLPWGKHYENEEFKRPDFTSLEILAFACSGTPVGINIPNYDDIRQNFGFKNVNLGNVYGKPNRDHVRYLCEEDLDLFVKHYQDSLFVIVALHELLGHGSGKVFMQDKDGKLNFDPTLVLNPFTNQNVNTFYTVNEHWHTRFGELSGAYEECKADAVALYLSTFDDVLEVLLPSHSLVQRHDIVYAAWIDIIYSSLKGLEYYKPEQKKWGQPHILASYVLAQVLMQEDQEMIKFIKSERDGKPYFTLRLNREKIWTVGRTAIGKLLKGLQIFKSIGAGEEGLQFFNNYTQVNDKMLEMREIVLMHKTPRKLELQHDVQLSNNTVQMVTFEESIEGLIQSQIFHYGGQVEDVKELFLTTQQLFKKK